MSRYFQEFRKKFLGDPDIAQQYIGLASKVLGGLKEMSGQLFSNTRTVEFPDGAKITASFQGAIHQVLIDVRRVAALATGNFLAIVVDTVWPATETKPEFDGQRRLKKEGCTPKFVDMPQKEIGCLDWLDTSGSPALWVAQAGTMALARYFGSVQNHTTIYDSGGGKIQTDKYVNGFTKVNGRVFYAVITDEDIAVYTSENVLVGSMFSWDGAEKPDRWAKFSASGDTGIVFYSSSRYIKITLVDVTASTADVTFEYVYFPTVEQVNDAQPRVLLSTTCDDDPLPGSPYSSFAGDIWSGITHIQALDFIGDDIYALYVFDGFASRYINATYGSSNWSVRAYAIDDLTRAQSNNPHDLSKWMFRSRKPEPVTALLGFKPSFYDDAVPLEDINWDYSRVVELDIRRKAGVFETYSAYGDLANLKGRYETHTLHAGVIVDRTYNGGPTDWPGYDLSVFDQEPWVGIMNVSCGGVLLAYPYTIPVSGEVSTFDVMVENSSKAHILSCDNDSALIFYSCVDGITTNTRTAFVCGGAATDITTQIPAFPTDHGYAVLRDVV